MSFGNFVEVNGGGWCRYGGGDCGLVEHSSEGEKSGEDSEGSEGDGGSDGKLDGINSETGGAVSGDADGGEGGSSEYVSDG